MQQTSQRKPIYNGLRNLLPSAGNVIFTVFMIGITLWAQSVGAISLGTTAAQTSVSTIPYQGFLTDVDEQPLTGAYDMKFCLYDSATGGTSLWCEQWNGTSQVQLDDGLFSVLLGSQNAISQNTIADNSTLFLGVTIGADELTPRAQIGSGISAMQALSVPDGSITAAKLAPDVLENYTVTTPQEYWWVPNCGGSLRDDAPWQAIPGLSIDFTLNESKTLWIDFAGLGRNRDVGKAIYSNIFIDNTRTQLASGGPDISGCRNSRQDTSGISWCSLSNMTSITLGPGNHTIDAKVHCDGDDGRAQVYGGTLRALVLP